MDELINKIRRKEVVLWAGAGLSSYAGMPTSKDIIEKLIQEVPPDLQNSLRTLSHSLMDVAEEFQQIHGRNSLIKILDELFSIEEKNLELHKGITQIPQIKKIMTTNYDCLFEKAYGNNISVIIKDVNLPIITKPIELFKIHGDLKIPESIIISKSDYSKIMIADTLFWKDVSSLIGRNSILFIGYSLDDINIKNLFDNISSKLGSLINNSYLVAPDLSQHRRRWLESNFHIVYIDKTAEEFIPSVVQEVHKYLKIDIEAGFISPGEAINIFKGKGMDVEFQSKNGKTIMSSLNLLEPVSESKGELQFTGVKNSKKLMDLLEGKSFNGVKFPSKDIRAFNFNISGVELIKLEDINVKGSLVITPLPSNKETADLKLEKTNYIIENVIYESYTSKHLIKVMLVHEFFSISIEMKKHSIKANIIVNYKLTKSVIKAKNIVAFLLEWLSGDTINIYLNQGGDIKIIPSPDMGKENNNQIEKLNLLFDIYSALFEIQNYFKITFEVPEKINRDERDKIEILLQYIKGEKVPIKFFEAIMQMEEFDNITNYFKENKVRPINILVNRNYLIDLFDRKLDLGKVHVEALDTIIENLEDVEDQYKSGSQNLTLKLISKSDEMYLSFLKNDIISE